MLYPIKVIDIELSHPLVTIGNLDGFMGLQALVRLHGRPIGYVSAPVTAGQVSANTISKLILEQHHQKIIIHLLEKGLFKTPPLTGWKFEDLLDLPPLKWTGDWPLVTVAVCTRNRTADLELCLNSLVTLDYPYLDLLVIDNAPTSDATEQLIKNKYPQVRYVREPRPGLNWARNRAIIEAKGEIIAYTDDDVIVDSDWVKSLAQVFAEEPQVMAVTGLVVPYELETEAQVLFEKNGGFGRGFETKRYQISRGQKLPWSFISTPWIVGVGANMAFRRSMFSQIGYFDPALDVGTLTNGGGDLEIFFRTLKEGHLLIYEPNALVRHRHRQEYEKLRSQVKNNAGSVFACFVREAIAYPDERLSLLRVTLWLVRWWYLRDLFLSLMNASKWPRDLVIDEIMGSAIGFTTYQKAHKIAAEIEATFGPLPPLEPLEHPALTQKPQYPGGTAVRTLELTEAVTNPLTDVTDYSSVRLFVTWKGSAIAHFDIPNYYQPISATHLRQLLSEKFGLKLLNPTRNISDEFCAAEAIAYLRRYYKPAEKTQYQALISLPANVSVSVVVATYSRPDDLHNCLTQLTAQKSPRKVEIIIVDNNPDSGVTPPIVADFKNVVLVTEPRQGAAYARNAGIAASTGDIIVTTDDDVGLPSGWLEKLLVPFARPDVMAVTSNILPLELETESQWLFEQYGDGGLGRGFKPFEATGDWFRKSWRYPVPTWKVGATANAAFRADIFSYPEISLMDEALGPGMPSGVGEDIYLFYKIIKSGYTVAYEPQAFIWHKHRRDLPALRRQLHNYSKGIVSYQLTTLLRDGDLRSLLLLGIDIPLWHASRIKSRLKGQTDYPIYLVLHEALSHLPGPWSLWQSRLRVKREGHSQPYIPVSERSVTKL
ncbi:glycosyltransferase [Kamptonema animale CS-326]|uniref:glycosyltransferase n=1 Tax=Kamptonema animale TaxID=92934 RepID=UPI00232F5FF0|nr:glycosyltransferase [Kamptonema animale]MDB9514886.1 glycosyltransferase [Kamptonema animale CS-326]